MKVVSRSLGYDINNLVLFAFVGIIIKLFLGSSTTEDGSRGPASAAVWGYGVIAASVLGIMFITFAMASQMTKLSQNDIGFIKSLFLHSLPPVLMLTVLIWLITINGEYFKRINQGEVAAEYNTYNNLSTFMVMIQLGVLYKYMIDELLIGKGGPTNKTMLVEALRSRLASVTYLLTLGNMMVASVMTIILKYFSTDG
tara:strand:- start:1468 stop:2061 length:594 start_codon:yes stop_codon:yes gene_type:complete